MTPELTDALRDGPVDDAARARLAERGLRLARIPSDDRAGFDAFFDVVARGFLGGEPPSARRDAAFDRTQYRRMTAVFDDAALDPAAPVGTFASWATELTVPGGEALAASAISDVTVSPTHRRRGIARAMMEGELRRAASLGFAAAVLTVSESPLYGRYGFAPAVFAASWTVDVTRASWIGPHAPGRVDFVSRDRGRELLATMHERYRASAVGETPLPGDHADRIARTSPGADDPDKLRVVQYADPAGTVQGVAFYTVTENAADFAASRVDVGYLLALSDEAYAGLWRFFLEMDLIAELRAGELSVDEPLQWMISDQRAAKVAVSDHHYVRILDVAAALEARRYDASGAIVFEVDDPLGIDGGRFVLEVDGDGRGRVTRGEAPAGAVAVRLGTAELSAAYLGSVSLATLAAAGRVRTADAAAAATMLSWHERARLSFWY